jgi:hypothetical protein
MDFSGRIDEAGTFKINLFALAVFVTLNPFTFLFTALLYTTQFYLGLTFDPHRDLEAAISHLLVTVVISRILADPRARYLITSWTSNMLSIPSLLWDFMNTCARRTVVCWIFKTFSILSLLCDSIATATGAERLHEDNTVVHKDTVTTEDLRATTSTVQPLAEDRRMMGDPIITAPTNSVPAVNPAMNPVDIVGRVVGEDSIQQQAIVTPTPSPARISTVQAQAQTTGTPVRCTGITPIDRALTTNAGRNSAESSPIVAAVKHPRDPVPCALGLLADHHQVGTPNPVVLNYGGTNNASRSSKGGNDGQVKIVSHGPTQRKKVALSCPVEYCQNHVFQVDADIHALLL